MSGNLIMVIMFLLVTGGLAYRIDMDVDVDVDVNGDVVYTSCIIHHITLETLFGLMLIVVGNVTLSVKSQLTQADKVNFQYSSKLIYWY